MKLLHIADLHIGKRVNEFNMIEDQRYILEQILRISEEERPEAILIAGDVYDKSQPSAEAVELLDEFLTKLTAGGQTVFMISGNHDSPERLSFGSRILRNNGLHIAGIFDGVMQKTTIRDEYNLVNIYLLPFLKPAMVKRFFEQPIDTYDEAVSAVISATEINTRERNILLAHQFVSYGAHQPERSESETLSIGGLDNVDASIFDSFDYVALGHLHGPQKIGRDTIRYAGSPLKYSFSEARHKKSAALIELKAKGSVEIKLLPLTPLYDLREIKGPIAELLCMGRDDVAGSMDYIHVTLTDEEEIYDPIGQLRQVYPNLMVLDFDNSRNRQAVGAQTTLFGDVAKKSPLELFADFYALQNNNELTSEEKQVLIRVFEQAGGGI
ncbi:MAG: exonuclease SbcCD subunit D [Peptococcaceae bacterium]|nr:exonuclease SbcCD subunit D [Peptococcaceae bacterium]